MTEGNPSLGDACEIACDNQFDDDGDGLRDLDDGGCRDAADDTETGSGPCNNLDDDDGDGFTDFGEDPVCVSPLGRREHSQCQDGLDNDGDGYIDFDGGVSINGNDPPPTFADLGCPSALPNSEFSPVGCGIGFEIGLLLPPLMWIRRKRRERARG